MPITFILTLVKTRTMFIWKKVNILYLDKSIIKKWRHLLFIKRNREAFLRRLMLTMFHSQGYNNEIISMPRPKCQLKVNIKYNLVFTSSFCGGHNKTHIQLDFFAGMIDMNSWKIRKFGRNRYNYIIDNTLHVFANAWNIRFILLMSIKLCLFSFYIQ